MPKSTGKQSGGPGAGRKGRTRAESAGGGAGGGGEEAKGPAEAPDWASSGVSKRHEVAPQELASQLKAAGYDVREAGPGYGEGTLLAEHPDGRKVRIEADRFDPKVAYTAASTKARDEARRAASAQRILSASRRGMLRR